ncbi:MAG: protein kinase [Deltaproteobacteria bacterium]|nr:protein kinase [Deltaproteobacteria bacterium]
MPKICPKCGGLATDTDTFCHMDGTPLEDHPVTPHQEASVIRLQAAPPEGDREIYIGKTILGHFKILEIAGAGSMGTVYKATQLEIDRTVAVKILHPELANQSDAVLRFHREAKVVSTLSHPNIVHIYLFGHLPDGNLYIIQEFIKGRSLAVDMSSGPLGLRRSVHIGDQILSAISDAHGHGVIHRDLKPENIMLTAVGDDSDFVKILDFGVAKRITTQTFATRDGLIFGSPRYISPEAAQGERVDQRSDLYSLGVMLYQMLCGEPPFESRKPVQLLMEHIKTKPPPLKSRPGASDVPDQVEGIVMKLLAKKPEHRYPTALAAREALIDATRGITPGAHVAKYVQQRGESVPAPFTKAAPPTVEDRPPAPGPVQARVPTAQAQVAFAGQAASPPIGEQVTDEELDEYDSEEDVLSTEAMYSMQHRARVRKKIIITIIVLVLLPALAIGGYYAYVALSKHLFPYDRVAETGDEKEKTVKKAVEDEVEERETVPLAAKIELDETEPVTGDEIVLNVRVTGLEEEPDKSWFVIRDILGDEVRLVGKQVQKTGDGYEGRIFTARHTFDLPGNYTISFLAGTKEFKPKLSVDVEEPAKGKKGKKKKTSGAGITELLFGPDVKGPTKVTPPDDKPPDKPPDKNSGTIKIIKVVPEKPAKKSSWY